MLRKFLALLAICCLLVTAVATASASTVRVVCNPNPVDRLNLRTEPSQDAYSLGKYYNGTEVEVLDEANGWAHVRVGTGVAAVEGYMMSSFLRASGAGSAVAFVGPTFRAESVTLYDATRNGRALATFENAWVEVVGEAGDWRHVRVDGLYGYLYGGENPQENGQPAAIADTGEMATVNNPNPADRLNLRTAPDKGAESLGRYYNGVSVRVLDKRTDGWALVDVEGVQGYMRMEYLAFGSAAASVTSACPTLWVANANAADRLNLRADCSRESRSLGRYPNGTQVTVLAVVNDAWLHVIVEGQTGYMMAQYLRAEAGVTSPPDAASRITQTIALEQTAVCREPDAASEALTVLAGGQSVYVLVRGDVWTYVSTGGVSGYVPTPCLEFVE